MSKQRRPSPTRHGFEDMPVFELSLRFLEVADSLDPVLRQRVRALNYHLQDAAISIVANLGEGATDLSRGDKRRFYRYALRSTGECSALLHAAEHLRIAPTEEIVRGKALLLDLRANLLRLIFSTWPGEAGRPAERRKASDGRRSRPP